MLTTRLVSSVFALRAPAHRVGSHARHSPRTSRSFSRNPRRPRRGRMVLLQNGRVTRVLAHGLPFQFNGGPARSPDGKYIAFGNSCCVTQASPSPATSASREPWGPTSPFLGGPGQV
jgi:hypothetical protein